MSRSIKEMICGDIKKAYADLDGAMVVNVHKLSGTDVNTLRGLLKKQKVSMHVIKNRFAKRVLAGTALEPIGAILTGPCAFVTGGSSSVDVAKQLVALVKDYPAPGAQERHRRWRPRAHQHRGHLQATLQGRASGRSRHARRLAGTPHRRLPQRRRKDRRLRQGRRGQTRKGRGHRQSRLRIRFASPRPLRRRPLFDQSNDTRCSAAPMRGPAMSGSG